MLATFLGGEQHLVGGDLDVGGHPQHLLEALPLVEILGEAEPGAGDRCQRLAPSHQVTCRQLLSTLDSVRHSDHASGGACVVRRRSP